MTLTSRDITKFQFSTADWVERDRLAIFREQIGRMIVKLDPEPLVEGEFHAEAVIIRAIGNCANRSCWHLHLRERRRVARSVASDG